MRSLLLGIVAIAFAATSRGQDLKPVEVFSIKKPGQIGIPYKKYVLPNGLTVILHEDHSDPLVHVDITYHVGSAREELGKSGFAHFFEHMMFQGSDHVADDQHFKIIQEVGGTLNGTTNRDRTNYYETVPSNQLERVLWLEADRMGFFLDAVTQKKFEIQRATVKNERAQRYDNRPYGLLGEVIAKNLYPAGHPYSWLTIGYIDDLNRADLQDLKNFFLRWYGPNNATLTIGGDIAPNQTLQWVQKYFGTIPKGPDVVKDKPKAMELKQDRFITLTDNYATLPQLSITFPTVPHYHPDMAALACLGEIIGQGKSSLFYQKLIKTKKAVSATAGNYVYELAGEFSITATPMGNMSMKELYEQVKSLLDSFEQRGVTQDDLDKFKGAYEAHLLNGLQAVSGKVSQLAAFETFTDDPNMLEKLLQMNRSVTKDDVLRVYQQYIKGKPSVIVSVVPKTNPANVAAQPNFTADSTTLPLSKPVSLSYKKGVDAFDRSVMPKAATNPDLKMPEYWRQDWSDGVKFMGLENTELPLVSLSIGFRGGHLGQASDTSKAGLSRMLALMLNEDTKKRSAEDFQVELQKLGASISVTTSVDRVNFNVSALKKNLAPTVKLLQERILEPSFTAEAFTRLQQQTLEIFKLRNSQPTFIADKVFGLLTYGKGHILAIDQFGTPWSVKNMTLADISTLYDQTIRRGDVQVIAAGDVDKDQILTYLGFLKNLPAGNASPYVVAEGRSASKTKLYLVDIPNAAQSEVRLGKLTGVPFDATGEFYKAGLMNYVLGGSFTSRLNLNLREDKGWTYAARSVISGDKYSGTFVFAASIKSEATDSSLVEVRNEIERYRSEELPKDETAFMKSAISQREALRYETLPQKSSFLRTMLEYNLPPTFLSTQSQILKSLTPSEVKEIAAKWLPMESMNMLVVGNKNEILPGIKRLGYEIVELDQHGVEMSGGN